MNCSKLIKMFLLDRGASVADLARRLGGSRSAVYDMIRRNDLRVSQLERIAAAYNCRVVISFTEQQPEQVQPGK